MCTGMWGQQMQTIIYRMQKLTAPLQSTGDCTQYPVTSHRGKEHKKELYIYIYIQSIYIFNHVYIYMIESLDCTAEINTPL